MWFPQKNLQKQTEQLSKRQTRPPAKLRINSSSIQRIRLFCWNKATATRLTMRIWGRLVNRALFLSSSYGGSLSKPLNPRSRVPLADASRRYIFSSASSSSGRLSDLNVLKSSPCFSRWNQLQGPLKLFGAPIAIHYIRSIRFSRLWMAEFFETLLS